LNHYGFFVSLRVNLPATTKNLGHTRSPIGTGAVLAKGGFTQFLHFAY